MSESVRFALFLGFAGIYMVLMQRIWKLVRGVREFRAQLGGQLWRLLIPLVNLSHSAKKGTLLLLDGALIYLVLALSLLIRFGEWQVVINHFNGPHAVGIWAAPLLAFPVFAWFGLYRSIIRYFGSQALWAVAGAVTLYGLLYAGGWLLIGVSGHLQGASLPNSVLLLHLLLLLLAVGGSRMAARWLLSGQSAEQGGRERDNPKRRVVVVGAGESGRQLASKAGSNLLFWHIFGIGGEQGENALAVRSDRVDYTFA